MTRRAANTKEFTERTCRRPGCGLLFQPVGWQRWRVRGYCSERCAPRELDADLLLANLQHEVEQLSDVPLSAWACTIAPTPRVPNTITIHARAECAGQRFVFESQFDEVVATSRGERYLADAIGATLAFDINREMQ